MKPQDDPALRPASQQCAGLPLLAPVDTRRAAQPDPRRAARAEARDKTEGVAATNRKALLAAFKLHGPMTPDTAGERSGLSPWQARPRCTELQGAETQPAPLLTTTGDFGLSCNGNPMAILMAIQ